MFPPSIESHYTVTQKKKKKNLNFAIKLIASVT